MRTTLLCVLVSLGMMMMTGCFEEDSQSGRDSSQQKTSSAASPEKTETLESFMKNTNEIQFIIESGLVTRGTWPEMNITWDGLSFQGTHKENNEYGLEEFAISGRVSSDYTMLEEIRAETTMTYEVSKRQNIERFVINNIPLKRHAKGIYVNFERDGSGSASEVRKMFKEWFQSDSSENVDDALKRSQEVLGKVGFFRVHISFSVSDKG